MRRLRWRPDEVWRLRDEMKCPVCLGGGMVIYDHSDNPPSLCRTCLGSGRDNTDSPVLP